MSAVVETPSSAETHPTDPATQEPQETETLPVEEKLEKPAKREVGKMPHADLLKRQMSHCGEYTYQALNKVGKLSPEDTSKITQKYLKAVNATPKGEPFPDALEYLVVTGWQKKDIESRDVTLELTRALLRYSKTKIAHLAFAHQNETPIEFYNDYPQISEICRLLSAPIIQISEKDFLTVTSINPFTATAAARLISNEMEAEFGRKPFQFITTTDLNAWKYTRERHFGT